MADEEPTEDTKREKPKKALKDRLWSAVKWLLIIGFLVFILLSVLSRMGGNSDVLRETIEDFLTEKTPYTASITKLNKMHFFPNMIIDVEGVELRGGDAGTGEALIRVGTAKVTMSFFDVLFQPGQFKDIHIENLSAVSGSLLDKPVKVEYLKVLDEGDQANLELKGKIASHDVQAKFGLETRGMPASRTYKIGAEQPFEVNLARLKAEGLLRKTITGVLKLENFSLSVGETLALRGNLDLDPQDETRHGIKGQLRVEPGKSELDPNLVLDRSNEQAALFGIVRSEKIVIEDLKDGAPLIAAIDEFDKVFGSGKPGLDFTLVAPDMNLDLKGISGGGVVWGSIKTPVKLEETTLHIGPLDGTIIKGALSGDVHVKAGEGDAEMIAKIAIRDFDYAALQKQFQETVAIDGTATIALDLSSRGKTLEQLVDRLSGKAGFVGGKAKMEAGILNIWGGGLLNALLPSFEKESEMNVNCVVVNLDIKNLKAQSDAVFVDTRRITLHGEGTYDIKEDHMDMLLEPKAKDIAIGDIASAVNITGPLAKLEVSPNAFSLGKKVGGLLLGTVNPAFFALSLTDMGLTGGHPCKDFVIEKEVLPPPEPKSEAPLEAEQPAAESAEDRVGNE